MRLMSLFENEHKIISIVGMAKNAGKTVTMNHLIQEMAQKNVVVGLTSIGRDGERQDIVTKTDKPLIYVMKNTLIATAEMLFNLSEVKMAVLEVTSHQTSMGRVIIGRSLSDGFVQVGGPTTNSEIRAVSERMLALGADYVLVDGALDRTSSASPAVTDACILSTGAVLSRDMNKAVEKTAYKASLFGLKRVEDNRILEFFKEAEAHKKPILVNADGNGIVMDEVSTALGTGRIIAEAIDEATRAVIVPGALVTQTIMDVVKTSPHYKNLVWVIGDATKIFIEQKDWLYFKRIGVDIRVRYDVKLLAITVNPYAPSGYFYDSDLFISAIGSRVSELPIIDVMSLDVNES